MTVEAERRRHKRYRFPIVIDAPRLTALPFVPDDVSMSGFRALVSEKPLPDIKVSVSLQSGETSLTGRMGRVVWVKEESEPNSFSVGVALDNDGSEALSALLKSIPSN